MHALSESLETGVRSVQISSNGFWGKSKDACREILGEINEVAERYGKAVHICMSVDQYHQEKIPVTSLANIIVEHSTESYKNLRLRFKSFMDQESNAVVDELYKACHSQGVYLVSDNKDNLMYPAHKDELIEDKDENRTPEQRELLREMFGCESKDVPHKVPMQVLKIFIDFGKLIARRFDIGEGRKAYLIIPKSDRVIDFSVEREVINAGRGKELNGGNLKHEFKASYARESDILVIAPDGNAYMWPAQISEQIAPVSFEGKDIATLAKEMQSLEL